MNESKAARYQRLRRRAHAADVASGLLLLGVLALSPAGASLAAWADGIAPAGPGLIHGAVAGLVFITVVVLLWELVALPAVLYLALRVDKRFRSADHSVEGVLAAQLHVTLVALPAALAGATCLWLSVQLSGTWWWAVAGALLAAALAGAMQAAPVLFLKLGTVRPIGRRSLMAGLRELSDRTGVPVADVFELAVDDDSSSTALVTGLGRARRVFLASTVVRDWSDDEIAVVVAHEMAHHRHGDLWRTLALNAAVLTAGLWLANALLVAADGVPGIGTRPLPASLPFIALVTGLVWLVATPLRHAQSRAQERAADRFALQVTGEAEAFGSAVRRLGSRYLAEERPSALTRWLFHRHPSMAERLETAERFRQRERAERVKG